MDREQARREIDSLDYYLQNHTDDYGEESHTAMMMAIKALEQEPTDAVQCTSNAKKHVKNTLEDAISRRALKDLGAECIAKRDENGNLIPLGSIDSLPSVSTEKTGRWIVASDGYGDSAYICECSECKDTVWVYKDADRKWNYCPNCGARMREVGDKKLSIAEKTVVLPKGTFVSRWIPVSERLPEEGTYLICTDDGYIASIMYDRSMGWLLSANIVAWMPLPEPYKGEREDAE